MKRHEQVLATYRRNHQGPNAEETERGKIQREKAQAKKWEERAARTLNRATDETAEDTQESATALLHRARKNSGNARTHSTRLHDLMKNEKCPDENP